MRVLVLLTGRNFGGVETHVYLLARVLADDGVEVVLTSFRELSLDPQWEADLIRRGVRLVRPPESAEGDVGIAQIFRARASLRRHLRGAKFHRVIGQGHGGALALMREFLTPKGYLLWHEYWHGLPTRGDRYEAYRVPEPRRFGWKMRRVLACVDGIVTGCDRARRHLRGIQRYEGPLLVIPPMTTAMVTPERPDDARADGPLRIVFVGRLGFGKGAQALLDVWPLLNIGAAELHFHGMVPEGRGSQIVDEHRSTPNVFFHGAFDRRDLPAILSGADLGLMLSIEEGFGLVACEYMSAGLPFVMTDCGAAEEFSAENPDVYKTDVSTDGIRRGIEEMVRRLRAGQTSRTRLRSWYGKRFDCSYISALHRLAVRADPCTWNRDMAAHAADR